LYINPYGTLKHNAGASKFSMDPLFTRTPHEQTNTFSIQLDKDFYRLKGNWQTRNEDGADLNNIQLSFNNLVTIGNENSLIHPDEIESLKKLLTRQKSAGQLECSFRIITPTRDIRWIEGSGVLEENHRANLDLLKATMDSSMDLIQVFEAVRNSQGEIVDFRWILNNHTAAEKFGNVIGKRLLEMNPGLAEVGIFNTFKQVVETGVPDKSERHYVHERFSGWFIQSTVKLNDGVATTTTEITALKRKEDEIRSQAHFIDSVNQAIPDIISIIELPSRKLLYCNRKPSSITGFTSEEISRMSVEEHLDYFAHEDDGPILNEFYNKLENMPDGSIIEIAYRFKKKNAGISWLRVRGTAFQRDSQGRVTQALVIGTDISKQKAADFNLTEQKLETVRTNNLLESVLANTLGRIMLLNPKRNAEGAVFDFQYALTNTATVKSVNRGHLEGKSFLEEFPEATTTGLFNHYVKVLETGNAWRGESHIDFAGLNVWSDVYAVRVGDSVLVTYYDITERKNSETEILRLKDEIAKQAEDRYYSLFNSIDEGFCILQMLYDENGRAIDWKFLEVNPAFEKNNGLHNAIGKTIRQLAPNIEPKWIEIYDRVAQTGQPIRFEEDSTALGRIFTLYAFPVGNASDRCVAVIFTDITKQKEVEHMLKELNAKLQEMDKVKTNFFHNVSHEFRTPLTLLLGPLEEVMNSGKSKLTTEDVQRLQFSHRSAMRLQKLVNTLLDFSRIEAGKLEAFYQPTDFCKTTIELAANFRSAIEKGGLKYVVKADEVLEPIYLNREMWEKIVFNLLSNAFKFTQSGKIEVRLRNKKKTVELHVKDSGIGIAEKNLERIFERFTRIEGSRARTYEGTGIGLALIRELVSVHGGTIKVKSQEGQGSEFIVSIPKGKSHLPKQQIYESKEQLPGKGMRESYVDEALGWIPEDVRAFKRRVKKYEQSNEAKILIVEDNADMRAYLTNLLCDDYEVLAMEHGKKVIDFLNDGGQTDLILADVMMPEIDGYQLTKVIKSNPKYSEIPVVLLSAKTSEKSKIGGLEVGADDYLVKPFSARELRALVGSRIRSSHVRKEHNQILYSRNLELEHLVQERTLELVQLNESLKQRNIRLINLNEELTNFAFIASHDLREPLRKIHLYAVEIADRESAGLTDRGRHFANKIVGFAQRMNELIEDVLTYTKISSHPRRNHSETDLNSLLTEVLDELSETIHSANAKIIVNRLPSLACNRLQISQLFQNLISNAIKFQSPHRQAEVTITGTVVPGETIASPMANMNWNYAKIEIADNGIGIEEKYMDKIFGIFQRLHPHSAYPGTGIGLAICKKVLENHNGFITAKSELGNGSIFSCFIPIVV
jgi:signal transduction histidine kinase